MAEDRLMTGGFREEDSAVEQSLRPHTLREYVGQKAVKDSLGIYIQAALTRHDALDHMLLYGPPAWAKPPWPALWPRRWGRTSALPPARPLTGPGTWPPSSAT